MKRLAVVGLYLLGCQRMPTSDPVPLAELDAGPQIPAGGARIEASLVPGAPGVTIDSSMVRVMTSRHPDQLPWFEPGAEGFWTPQRPARLDVERLPGKKAPLYVVSRGVYRSLPVEVSDLRAGATKKVELRVLPSAPATGLVPGAPGTIQIIASVPDHEPAWYFLTPNESQPILPVPETPEELAALLQRHALSDRLTVVLSHSSLGDAALQARFVERLEQARGKIALEYRAAPDGAVVFPLPKGQDTAPPIRLSFSETAARLPRLEEALRRQIPWISLCYRRGLARHPQLAGKMTARLVLNPRGTVEDVGDGGSDLADQAVTECFLRTLQTVVIPAHQNREVVIVFAHVGPSAIENEGEGSQ